MTALSDVRSKHRGPAVARADSRRLHGQYGVYDARRVCGDPREAGAVCSKNRVAKIMQRNGIRAIRGYTARRRIAGLPSIFAPNRLSRPCTVEVADRVWVTDITYPRTWQD